MGRSGRGGAWALVALLAWGCREESRAPPLSSLAPLPLSGAAVRGAAVAGRAEEVLPSGALALEPFGEAPVGDVERWPLDGSVPVPELVDRVRPGARVLLVPDADRYLAELAPLLAALDDAGARVWLAHPAGALAFELHLRDEPSFQSWIDAKGPGKIRVIQRGDGFELTTSVGKLPGPDANGPSVPLRGGQQDLGRLRLGLLALHERFGALDELCWVPSFGMELARTAEAMAAAFVAPGRSHFARQCLVYPRPR